MHSRQALIENARVQPRGSPCRIMLGKMAIMAFLFFQHYLTTKYRNRCNARTFKFFMLRASAYRTVKNVCKGTINSKPLRSE